MVIPPPRFLAGGENFEGWKKYSSVRFFFACEETGEEIIKLADQVTQEKLMGVERNGRKT